MSKVIIKKKISYTRKNFLCLNIKNYNVLFFRVMPQVDMTLYLPIIFSLVKWSSVFYIILLVFLFYPFVSQIKVIYNFFAKIRQIKEILLSAF